MFKFLVLFLLAVTFLLSPKFLSAEILAKSFVNIVLPVRGSDFWSDNTTTPLNSLTNYLNKINSKNLKSTILIRYDALNDKSIISFLKNDTNKHELGLFLEVTPSITEAANVEYHNSTNWHHAESVLVTGYTPSERIKIIDVYFSRFKSEFGYYPQVVGAWWIDAYSLSYMRDKYKIVSNLSVADQFSTDGYQVWGQFWSSPFYPSKLNASQPAQDLTNKIGIVTIQWASRDPYNAFGSGVEDSTFSVQANDYLLHPNLDIKYFSKLLDIYLKENKTPFGHITVGIENDFTKDIYVEEFNKQIDEITTRLDKKEVDVVTMSEFANWYSSTFSTLSPAKVIFTKNPIDGQNHVLWFSNINYRAGLFQTNTGLILRDLRLYSDTMKEPCLEIACKNLDLARIVSKPLDDVTFKQHLQIENGEIRDLKIKEQDNDMRVDYKTGFGKDGKLLFTKNDIYINDKPFTISGLIIENTSTNFKQAVPQNMLKSPPPRLDLIYSLKASVIFIIACLLFFVLPGRFVIRRFLTNLSFMKEIVLGAIIGIVCFILVSYISLLIRTPFLTWVIMGGLGLLSFREKFPYLNLKKSDIWKMLVLTICVVISVLPVFKSGLIYLYGMGFWGPNGHDAIWHLALIESIRGSIPPENFLFSQTNLTNYHYFFDIVLAQLSNIPTLDKVSLYFRLWPVFISLVLGSELLVLSNKLGLNTISTISLMILTFAGGSWGWIVSFFRQGDFGGESMFWANQAISLHLNPPFALSLVLIMGLLIILSYKDEQKGRLWILAAMILGLLWGVKAYAGAIFLAAIFIIGIFEFLKRRDLLFIKIFILAFVISMVIFLPANLKASNLFEFSPLWLVHSMTDSPDRLGWTKLSNARFVYSQEGRLLKLTLAEILGIAIFLLGNLGGRVIGFPFILRSFVFRELSLKILGVSALVALIPTLLFVQKGNPWNIVQFFYYAMFVSNIFTALLINKLSKYAPKLLLLFGVSIFLMVSIPTTYSTLLHYFPNNAHSKISTQELDALSFLNNLPRGIVLSPPFEEKRRELYGSPFPLYAYVPSAYVSAFSGKPSFVSDQINLDILGIDYLNRIAQSKEFFRFPSSDWAQNFLKMANIKYIYIIKDYGFSITDNFLENIYENDEVKIFQVPNESKK